jgi:hypothetical protein
MPKARKPLTPAEVNARNAEYWKREGSAFHERIEKHPTDALAAAELVEELAKAGYLKAPKNLITATAGYERARSLENEAAVRKRHDKAAPERGRQKQKLLAAWRGGQFKSKKHCASVAGGKLGIAFRTALEYLRNK